MFTTRAKAALVEGNDALVVRILEILRSSISDEAMHAVIESDILGQMEEDVTRLCADLQGECNKKIVREKDKKDVNIPVSSQITARVNKELLPLVAKAERLAGKDSRMAKRCRADAADVLDWSGAPGPGPMISLKARRCLSKLTPCRPERRPRADTLNKVVSSRCSTSHQS